MRKEVSKSEELTGSGRGGDTQTRMAGMKEKA